MTDKLPTPQSHIQLNDITIGNDQPFVLFGGMNVLESKDLAFEIAESYIDICKRLNIGYVFKASFDKANRSSLYSFRGPGLEKGIEWLHDIKKTLNNQGFLLLLCLIASHFTSFTNKDLKNKGIY